MAGSLKTPNYDIPYYAGTDIISNSTNTAAMLKIDSELKNVDTKATNVNDIATEAKEAAENAVTQVESVVTTIGNLVDSDSKNTEAIATLKNQDAVINAHIVDLQNKDTSIDQEIETLNNGLSTANTNITNLEQEINNISSNVTGLENTLETEIDRINSSLENITTEALPGLETKITSNTTVINNNAGAISALETDVLKLSNKALPISTILSTSIDISGTARGVFRVSAPPGVPGLYFAYKYIANATTVNYNNALIGISKEGSFLSINKASGTARNIFGFLRFNSNSVQVMDITSSDGDDAHLDIGLPGETITISLIPLMTPNVDNTRELMDNDDDSQVPVLNGFPVMNE